jgi:hypothetical protein
MGQFVKDDVFLPRNLPGPLAIIILRSIKIMKTQTTFTINFCAFAFGLWSFALGICPC